jgi:hypothetical protein
VFKTVSPSDAEMNPIFRVDMKNKLSLSIALAAALVLGFLPDIYASGPESDSEDRSDNIPGDGVTNATSTDCPIIDGSDLPYQQDLVDCNDNYYCKNYYGGDKTGLYDLLDRLCDDL